MELIGHQRASGALVDFTQRIRDRSLHQDGDTQYQYGQELFISTPAPPVGVIARPLLLTPLPLLAFSSYGTTSPMSTSVLIGSVHRQLLHAARLLLHLDRGGDHGLRSGAHHRNVGRVVPRGGQGDGLGGVD